MNRTDDATKSRPTLAMVRFDVGNSITGTPSFWLLWLFGYAYAVVIALVLQKLVMPIMPDQDFDPR
jgi:hypothetical protein